MFDELLRRHDVSRTDALVYGAIAYFEHCGERASTVRIGQRLSMDPRCVQYAVRRLLAIKLVGRDRSAKDSRLYYYAPLGPRLRNCAA